MDGLYEGWSRWSSFKADSPSTFPWSDEGLKAPVFPVFWRKWDCSLLFTSVATSVNKQEIRSMFKLLGR